MPNHLARIVTEAMSRGMTVEMSGDMRGRVSLRFRLGRDTAIATLTGSMPVSWRTGGRSCMEDLRTALAA